MGECSEGAAASQRVNQLLIEFVRPLSDQLDERLDKRLVRTFVGLLQVIVVVRHNRYGLLLSELGGYLLGAAQAAAGTKRISNLLRSKRWEHEVVGDHLWQQTARHVRTPGEPATGANRPGFLNGISRSTRARYASYAAPKACVSCCSSLPMKISTPR